MPDQVDINFEAFQIQLPNLLKKHAGKFALLHDSEVVGYFNTSFEAFKKGNVDFGEGQFSVQEVTDRVESLGFYSNVGGKMYA